MEVDDIISYHDLVTEEKAALQKGMNFGVGKKYSILRLRRRRTLRLHCRQYSLSHSRAPIFTGALSHCPMTLEQGPIAFNC
jgi:hypothetical protein